MVTVVTWQLYGSGCVGDNDVIVAVMLVVQ